MRVSGVRYFFDLNEHSDDTGTELPHREAVQREALALILAVAAEDSSVERPLELTVRDEHHRQIFTAHLHVSGTWADHLDAPQT